MNHTLVRYTKNWGKPIIIIIIHGKMKNDFANLTCCNIVIFLCHKCENNISIFQKSAFIVSCRNVNIKLGCDIHDMFLF